MSEHPTTQKLTEDDIREILLSDAGHAELARKFGVVDSTIATIRKRTSKRVLKIAASLGLLPISAPRECWAPRSRTAVKAPDRFVRARAAGEGRGASLTKARA